MPYSYINFSGNGSQTDFPFPFPYIDAANISVSVNGVSTAFTLPSANIVRITPAPANGAVGQIKRTTLRNEPLVDFTDGSVLGAEQLDLLAIYDQYIAEEAADAVAQTMAVNSVGKWDGQNRVATNFANPVAAQDLATKSYADSTITTAAASAASASSSASAASGSASAAAASAASASASAVAADAAADAAEAALAGFDGSAYVQKSGSTMTGHLSVPAGATGAQAPRANEVLGLAGGTLTGTLGGTDIVLGGASGGAKGAGSINLNSLFIGGKRISGNYASAKGSGGTSVPASVFTKVPFTIEIADPLNNFASSRWTCPSGEDGLYLIFAASALSAISSGKDYILSIFKNNNNIGQNGPGNSSGITIPTAQIIRVETMVAGDFVEAYCWHNDVSAQTINSNSIYNHFFVMRIM